jgi:hypothetical protein
MHMWKLFVRIKCWVINRLVQKDIDEKIGSDARDFFPIFQNFPFRKLSFLIRAIVAFRDWTVLLIGSARGRCYDHNFRRKKSAFFLILMLWSTFSKFSFVLSQKRQFFRKKFRRKYLKNHNIGCRFEKNFFSEKIVMVAICDDVGT